VHAAHRLAHHQTQVADGQAFRHQPVLRVDHVLGVVLGESCLETVGRLRRPAVADRVRQDDVIFARIERLARAEQLAREGRCQHAAGGPAGPMQDQHRLAGRFTDGRVGEAELGHHFAGVKFEVPCDPFALSWRGIVLGLSVGINQRQDERGSRLNKLHGVRDVMEYHSRVSVIPA